MKFLEIRLLVELLGPAPQGAGGLKFPEPRGDADRVRSRPARGGWIEIPQSYRDGQPEPVPPRKGRVD